MPITINGNGTIGGFTSGLPAGSILQVKETFLDTAFNVTYAVDTDTDVTGLSVSLTPTAATSKMLIFVRLNSELASVNMHQLVLNLKRNGTFVGRPAASGSRRTGLQGTSMGYYDGDATSTMDVSQFHFLDSPNTTALITYQVSMICTHGTTMHVNRTLNDFDTKSHERLTSSIVVMEVAG